LCAELWGLLRAKLIVCILLFQELVKKYSEFINFPIYLWSSKEVDVEVPVDEDEEADKETPPGRFLSLDFLVEIWSQF